MNLKTQDFENSIRFHFDKTIINHPETKLFQICRSHKKTLSAYVETTDLATLRLNYGNRKKVTEKFAESCPQIRVSNSFCS